jgi:chlorite dismutase/heme-degrading monooxygenase HmoA
MPDAPPTDEGWFVLHDFRTVDWDAWRDAPDRERERAIAEGTEYLRRHEDVVDADEGASAVFSVLGHKADLLVVHFRPTLDDLSRAERRFEASALAGFTEQPTSYVSVTEISGYSTPEYFEDPESVDEGVRRYMEGKLTPDIPDDEYVSFYPMSKRRGEEDNWYDLPFDERAEMMETHAETGKEYAGKIKQVIASSVGFDDFEWGVTLFSDDPTHIKDIVYDMRFDEVSSKYGEFGQFYVGRRFPPADLGAYLEGAAVPTSEHDADPAGEPQAHGEAHGHAHGDAAHGGSGGHGGAHGGGSAHGDSPHGEDGDATAADDPDDIREELADLDIYAGQPHGEDVYATVLYSEADTDELFDEVDGLRGNFDHYDTHVKTAVYEARGRDRSAVVSIWDTASAAETAAGFLSELPEVVSRAGEESGFGTMGMFYTVKSDYREDFHDTFDDVEDVLEGMDGHRDTDLLVNVEDENDMFISSQWDARENAMAFFRSEEFSETVKWGRDVLADRPRHVFLA